MEKKKILYFHASADLYGSDYVLLCLIKGLDKTKFDPIVILPYKGRLCEEFDKHSINYRIYDIPVLRRSVLTFRGIIVYILLNISFFFAISRLIRKEKIDILHTNTSAIWMGGFISWIFRKKHIWQVMELVEEPKIVSYLICKIVGIFSTKVFTISVAVNDFFVKRNKRRIDKFEVLYHGVDLNVYNLNSNNGQKVRADLNITPDTILVGMAGRINSWKGHDIFIRSIPLVTNNLISGQRIHFFMLGDCFKGQEHFEIELKELITSLNVADNLTFLGFQDNFQDWVAASDIFVLPSKLPEPNATITIAAMTMKKPLIATQIGGTVEAVINEETGILIPPNDENALAEKIIYLVKNKNKIAEYGRKGELRARNIFSIQNYCDRIVSEYLKG